MATKYSKEYNQQQIAKAASDMGEDPCSMLAFADIETGGTFNNVASNGGKYIGLFQFHIKTIKELGGTDADRYDPYKSTVYAIKYMRNNKKIFQKKHPGKKWEDWMAYVCHQQGGTGCTDIFGSSDSTPIAGHKRQAGIKSNIIGKTKISTIGEFKKMWENRFEKFTSTCSSFCPVAGVSGLGEGRVVYNDDGCTFDIAFDKSKPEDYPTNTGTEEGKKAEKRNFFLRR